jgi:ribonuclease BN (tRNA processing enzyme)
MEQRPNDFQLEHALYRWKNNLKGYKINFSHTPKRFDLRKIRASNILGQQKFKFWKKCHLDEAP